MRLFRNHGITTDHRQREREGSWQYEMVELGFNYRLTDLQCALAESQLEKANAWLARREAIAAAYTGALGGRPEIQCPTVSTDRRSAWHLYVIRLNLDRLRVGRAEVFRALRAENIGVNVHYIPVPWHPYYAQQGYVRGGWPVAESEYERLISLPMWPGMSDQDVSDTIVGRRQSDGCVRRVSAMVGIRANASPSIGFGHIRRCPPRQCLRVRSSARSSARSSPMAAGSPRCRSGSSSMWCAARRCSCSSSPRITCRRRSASASARSRRASSRSRSSAHPMSARRFAAR